MRRKAVGCTSESHSLYGTFMSRLPGCVFEWDANDVYNLKEARRGFCNTSKNFFMQFILLCRVYNFSYFQLVTKPPSNYFGLLL